MAKSSQNKSSLNKSSKKNSHSPHAGAGEDESARGRLLSAATHLFCKNGINATGIDAMKHKKIVLGHIEKLAGELGSNEPVVLAHQLGLLIDGAIVAAMVSRDPGVADTAALTAGPLLSQWKAKRKRGADQLETV